MGKEVPRCKECKSHVTKSKVPDGEAKTNVCTLNGKTITGMDARISPPWCPKRKKPR